MRGINLLPPEERGLLPRPWLDRLPFLPLGLVVLVALFLVGLNTAKIVALREQLVANSRLEARYAPYITLFAQEQAKQQTVSIALSLSSQVRGALAWSTLVNELQNAAPPGTVLSTLTPAKGTLAVAGTAPDLSSIALFLTRIPTLPYLGQPSFLGTSNSAGGGGFSFSLQIPLQGGLAP